MRYLLPSKPGRRGKPASALAAPVFTGVSPNSGTTAGGTSVTITGTGFYGTPVAVTFGGTTATSIVVVSSTSITCVTPAKAAAAVQVVVQTSQGTATGTNAFTFEAAGNSAGSVTAISPNNGTTAGGTAVTITGTSFVGTPAVTIGGNSATSIVYVSSTSITCVTPAHAAAAADVVVADKTLAGGYTYAASWVDGPAAGDTLVYDDNFATITGIFTDSGTYTTTAARETRRAALAAGSAEYFFYNGLTNTHTTASMQTAGGGLNGSTRYLRLDALNSGASQLTYDAQINQGNHPNDAQRFCPAGASLVCELWIRYDDTSAPNLSWIKNIELEDNTDRTQYGMYLSGSSLGWANIHPDSNNKEIYMHQEDGAGDAPTLYKRWSNVANAGWLHHTIVYKPSTTTGVTRDGVNLWYVESEKIIDASQYGKDHGWMVDRQTGVASNSTAPYPGNVGDKTLAVTGDQALLGLSALQVRRITIPGIVNLGLTDGSNTMRIEIGRIRLWYRP